MSGLSGFSGLTGKSPASPHVFDTGTAGFERDVLVASRTVPVVVDFWAPWCGPCRVLGPILERLAAERAGAFRLAKVNTDASPELAEFFGLQGIPAVKAFRDGRIAGEFTGAQPEAAVRAFLDKVVGPAAPAGDPAAGEAAAEPDPAAEALARLKALLLQGKGAEAKELLAGFPGDPPHDEAERLRPLAESLPGGAAPRDPEQEARAQALAARLARGDLAGAMEEALARVAGAAGEARDRERRILVGLFALAGLDSALTRDVRDRLARILF